LPSHWNVGIVLSSYPVPETDRVPVSVIARPA
jgi:hypothetical protein